MLGYVALQTTIEVFLMWTHYARGHRGFCLGINMEEVGPLYGRHPDIEKVVFIKKVTYQEKLPILNLFKIVPKNFQKTTVGEDSEEAQREINTFLSTKTKQWENEREWRLILRGSIGGKSQRAFATVNNLISCVYLGCRFPQNRRSEILKIASTRGLKVYQAQLSADGKGMVFMKLA